MYTFVITLLCVLWLFKRYCGWIASRILYLLTRCEIQVGAVRWLCLTDVRVTLPNGVALHVDSCSIQFLPQTVSKPILIVLGDVRIEGDSLFAMDRRDKEVTRASSTSGGSRLTQLVQYCGISVVSCHVVLLEAVPDCMIHVTVDDLSMETFRSRDGWQLELSCRLAQGKTLRRRGRSCLGGAAAAPLCEFALLFQVSIDVSAGRMKKLALRVEDPSVTVSHGNFDVIEEEMVRRETTWPAPGKPSTSNSGATKATHVLDYFNELEVALNNCTIKYIGECFDQSRYLALSINETRVGKSEEVLDVRVIGLHVVDQLQRTAIRTCLLAIAIRQLDECNTSVELSSDSVQTTLSIQDVLWWRAHLDLIVKDLRTTHKVPSPSETNVTPSSTQVSCSLEVASLTCQLVDIDSFQSTLSIKYLSFSKEGNELELGVESLVFVAPGTDTNDASFEKHQWGHSVYVGVALIQYVKDAEEPCLRLCVDDLKVEWSDRLAQQVHQLLLTLHAHSPNVVRSKEAGMKMSLQVKTKRAAVFMVAREATFVLWLCDELVVDSIQLSDDFAVSASSCRLGISEVKGDYFDVDELLRVEKSEPDADYGKDSNRPWRCWNNHKNNDHKAECRRQYEENRSKNIKLCGEAGMLCVSVGASGSVTRRVSLTANATVYLAWSPLLHSAVKHVVNVAKRTFTPPVDLTNMGSRKVPKVLHLDVVTEHPVELDLELPRFHRMLWKVPSMSVIWVQSSLSILSRELIIRMNGFDIITAKNVFISRRLHDEQMEAFRKDFGELKLSSNKVWTWSADLFRFFLPFEFNFAQVFDEFVNAFKWLKIMHGNKKKPFTADSPLPADVRIIFKEWRLELEDDEFENLLQTSHELKEDEVYECERRRQMLAERLLILKKANPLLPQSKMDELYSLLLQKNSEIYVERWRRAQFSKRVHVCPAMKLPLVELRVDMIETVAFDKRGAPPLVVMKLEQWEMRAFADPCLHGTDVCTQLIQQFDPLSYFPPDGLQFSTLWARASEFDVAQWTIHFRDYPIPYWQAKDMHFFGTLVCAEEYEGVGGRSLREADVPLPEPWETFVVQRNMMPPKFYYDMQCESSSFVATYGPCWEPCLTMISMNWNNVSAPSRDPSPLLPFWDKMRFLLHGRFSWLSSKVVTTMLASPDPYNATETVEMCWQDFGLDWALGEVRIRSVFSVFMRTASRYDDSRILFFPDLRLRIVLDWICNGDPHDHHAVTLCAPHKLPHYAQDHDSYRKWRSSCVDVSLSFDVTSGAGQTEMPHLMLFANTFRCIEFLMNTLTVKNRNIKKGKLFGAPGMLKPQLSKHLRDVQVSVNFPRFYISYRMSQSSEYGVKVLADGLNLVASLKLSMTLSPDTEVRRRRIYGWSPLHVSASFWGSEVHVFGENSGEEEGASSRECSEETLLLSIGRVSYVRENNPSKDSAVHRLTANDLKASWTASNRDACLSIADGLHRAHQLRRILSNDAIKILKLHMEEESVAQSAQLPQAAAVRSSESFTDERGHRRGYSISDTNQSMLNQLIDEASTKLVAHCEQTAELPTDSLLGVQQCSMDDVQMINWQIDLLNSQLVVKGCERLGGYVLLTASRASLTQKMHRCVWKSGQLLGKKSWSAVLSGMQYFAPVAMASAGNSGDQFRWLSTEVIEEKARDTVLKEDVVHDYIAAGEDVGGVVQQGGITPKIVIDGNSMEWKHSMESLQLQRIVSRCSCQIYFCYYSEDFKSDILEETGVPKVEQSETLRGEDMTGVDCLTLKHNMLESSSNSAQYEMVVDIVNNLLLFVDPKKKELAEHRRKLRFKCQFTEMSEMRARIVEQQSQLREIVSVVRSLERQLFYLDAQSQQDDIVTNKRKEIMEEMEECKAKQLEVSDQLAIYVSCFKQRQVEAARAVVHKVEDDGQAAIARRFEVCFEDCIWRLTDHDGQISLAQTQIRNFLYTRTMRIDNSGEHLFEIGSIRMTNCDPDSPYRDTLHRDERYLNSLPAIRLLLKDLAPVGGITVKEHFEVNIEPMVAQLNYQFFEKMMKFFFPGRNIHKGDNLDNHDEQPQKFSFARRVAGTLSMRSAKATPVDRKTSSVNKTGSRASIVVGDNALNDIERMRQRADLINCFLYIKIPEVPFIVTYKGSKDKNIEDVDRFSFLFPLCEFHEKNWTWLDLALAVKNQCKGVLIQQFMKQKLLRNRLALTGGAEPVEGISEEEKKKIALGTASTIDKKRKK